MSVRGFSDAQKTGGRPSPIHAGVHGVLCMSVDFFVFAVPPKAEVEILTAFRVTPLCKIVSHVQKQQPGGELECILEEFETSGSASYGIAGNMHWLVGGK